MIKVKIIFPSLFQLWDFKQIFRRRVLQTIFWRRSLVCLCSESEIELAICAYEAKVVNADTKEELVTTSL